ncbi:hypothetical protein N1031_05445 [Herbiconiux moechotypicola]|uniref:DUF4352 domain-containing protein n=1 Tax=Herbiconiux moechotypicola TaxID=637393 RepID=A0ABN3DDU6_9MICO|nr:hypothetical protein [Herbiconiux moechotypicola]MCS5729200.1 hypothetical protein [Herbiconiux moechotypicola]
MSGAVTETAAPSARVPWWRHLAHGVVLVVVLVVAGVVAHTAPTDAGWQAAIPVSGQLGERVVGRNIAATVDEVRVAERVVASNGWAGETTGVWVVVDATVESVVDDFGALLGTAQLRVGDVVYSASDRPDLGTLAGDSLATGIPTSGPLMFEVPRAVLQSEEAAHATVQLAINSDPRADSMIEVPIDLTALELQSSIETAEPGWANP